MSEPDRDAANNSDMYTATDNRTGLHQAVVEGLNAASQPLPGFFRQRSKQAVYATMANSVVESVWPVLEMVASEQEATVSDDDAGDAFTDAYNRGFEHGRDQSERVARCRGATEILTEVQRRLNNLDRTPRQAMDIVTQLLIELDQISQDENTDTQE